MTEGTAQKNEVGCTQARSGPRGEWGRGREGPDELSPGAVRPRKTSRLATAMATLDKFAPGKKEPKVPENG